MKNIAPKNPSDSRAGHVWAAVRDDLRERRQAQREYRALVRELESYRSRSDVDDLLAALENDTSAEAEQIRVILSRNLDRQQTAGLLAS